MLYEKGRKETGAYIKSRSYSLNCLIFKKTNLFIWLFLVLAAAHGIFDLHCVIQDLQWQHVGFSSVTKDQTLTPCMGSMES